MIKYVTIKKLSELTGYSQDAIRAKIKRGVWRAGKHFTKSPDNRIQLNVEAIQLWIEGTAV